MVDYSCEDCLYISGLNNQPKNYLYLSISQRTELGIVPYKKLCRSSSRVGFLLGGTRCMHEVAKC